MQGPRFIGQRPHRQSWMHDAERSAVAWTERCLHHGTSKRWRTRSSDVDPTSVAENHCPRKSTKSTTSGRIGRLFLGQKCSNVLTRPCNELNDLLSCRPSLRKALVVMRPASWPVFFCRKTTTSSDSSWMWDVQTLVSTLCRELNCSLPKDVKWMHGASSTGISGPSQFQDEMFLVALLRSGRGQRKRAMQSTPHLGNVDDDGCWVPKRFHKVVARCAAKRVKVDMH